MMLLALEFSAPARSFALFDQARGTSPARLRATRCDTGPRASGPLALVDALLSEVGVSPDKVTALAVGLGPGSYTGIRSAIALAQGWELARGIRIYGLGTADCLAYQAQQQGWFGRVTIGIDAQRSEFYLADYEISPSERHVIRPLRLSTLDELRAASVAPQILVGPEVAKWTETGRVLLPSAAALGELVNTGLPPVPADRLEPIYLRETSFVKASPPRKF